MTSPLAAPAAVPAGTVGGAPTAMRNASGSQPRSGLLRKGGWGLADQVLISAVNLLTMILLARSLGPSAFGVYVLVFTALQFANGLQNALIIQPHNVLAATRRGRDYAAFTTTSALAQLAFAAAAAGLALAASAVAYWQQWSTAPLLLALSPAAAAWQLQEFVRRVMYTELRVTAAFWNNLLSYGGQAVGLAMLWYGGSLSGPRALLVIAVTSGAAFALGVYQIRHSLMARPQWQVLRQSWQFGKWLGGAELGYWASSQAYLWLTGGMLGAAAAGMLKAAYTVFGPTRVFSFALRSLLPTWFSRTIHSGGKPALHQQLKRVYLIVVPLLGAYCLLVGLFAEPLLQLMFGDAYVGSSRVLMLYAVVAFMTFLASVVNAALRAQQLTRVVFSAQLLASFTLPLGWLCIRGFGVEGAVMGMMLTSLTVNGVFWWTYLRQLDRPVPTVPTAARSTPSVSPSLP